MCWSSASAVPSKSDGGEQVSFFCESFQTVYWSSHNWGWQNRVSSYLLFLWAVFKHIHTSAATSILLWCARWNYCHGRVQNADADGRVMPNVALMAVLMRQKLFLPTSHGLFSLQSDVLTTYSNSKTSLQGQNWTFQYIFSRDRF